ncbi:putative cyclin-L1-like protein [Escovopsis weberi]|uniref:Putative cyclin-L1-like protein n=1 Tax=Escovopsis weberi TaxID=150374 RepID=A0A0M9VT27_ESCWE|nr:putative cyclin-L1-like protein [Escovopsis weberi]
MNLLANPLATAEQLYSRTSLSSTPQDLQESVFIATQCLTQAAGRLLELPQSVTARANVILARYWLLESPMAHEFSDVSAAALYLTAKLSPTPRSPRDLSNVFAYLLSRDSALFRPTTTSTTDSSKSDSHNNPASYYVPEADYYAFRQRVFGLEARILRALGFDTRVALPHPLAITYLQALDFLSHDRRAISLRALQHLNTALLSPQLLYLTHQPHALAAAAIYAAARDLGAKMPECEWWEVFDVDREELGFLVVGMRSLEGWMRARREELPRWGGERGAMLTRAAVEEEVRRRRQRDEGGGGHDGADGRGAQHDEGAGGGRAGGVNGK